MAPVPLSLKMIGTLRCRRNGVSSRFEVKTRVTMDLQSNPSAAPSVPDESSPKEELADGRSAVWRTLGSGAQAEALEGVDRKDGRPVAIKRFYVGHARSWKDVDLAEREARVLQSLN